MSSVQAAQIQALQAMGAIVKVTPQQFQLLLNKAQYPLIVQSYSSGMFGGYKYMVNHKGFVFHTKSKERINLPSSAEVVDAKSIWVP